MKGYEVLGVDVVEEHVRKINNKSLVSDEPRVTELLRASQRLTATTDLAHALAFSDFIMIYVDTPTGPDDKVYDHKNLSNVLHNIVKRISLANFLLPTHLYVTILCSRNRVSAKWRTSM